MFGFYGNPAGGGFLGMGLPEFWNNTYAQWMRPLPFGRPWYTEDRAGRVLSTICQIEVCPKQAAAMRCELKQLESNPGKFDIVGWNCSSRDCEVLSAGGVLQNGIPGLDTPQDFQDALTSVYGAKCFNGYTSVDPNGNVAITPTGPGPMHSQGVSVR